VILLDTHVVVWLYGGQRSLIPPTVQHRLNAEQIGVSPFVQLELGYLYEIRRVTAPARTVIEELSARMELTVADVSAAAVCTSALDLTWTRDPFDRLLAAHAILAGLPLVTRDETIRQHLALAWWAD
jgi:PIN domain nuclease of toxin-antitoxin system